MLSITDIIALFTFILIICIALLVYLDRADSVPNEERDYQP